MPTNVTRGRTLTNTGSQFQSRNCCRTRLRLPSRTWNLSRLSLPSGIGDVTHAPSIAPIERAKCCAVVCRSFKIIFSSSDVHRYTDFRIRVATPSYHAPHHLMRNHDAQL